MIMWVLFFAAFAVRTGSVQASTNCCLLKYVNISTTHSALLDTPARDEEGFSEEEKQAIVDYHNQLRGSLEDIGQPAAQNMINMEWDDEIAKSAQNWASNCVFKHDSYAQRKIPCGFSVGQNIVVRNSWKEAIDAWFNEHVGFQIGIEGNHYTQVVSARSYKLGCGYAYCKPLKYPYSGTEAPGKYYVCNYGPTGNFGNSKAEQGTPYVVGTSGADCPDTYNPTTKLCECTNPPSCNWGMKLDPNTCKCDCIYSTLHQDENGQCNLDCSQVQDIGYCQQGFKDKCKSWINVPFACPYHCGLCPCPASGK